MNRKIKTKEELRRYDIFKGIVTAIIVILLLLSAFAGSGGAPGVSTSGTAAEPTGAGEEISEAAAEPEVTAPVLVDPAPGSELEAGATTLTGTGVPGSRIAIWAGDLELDKTAVDENGSWQSTVDLSPETSTLILQTLDNNGQSLAESTVTFTITAPAEPLSVQPLDEGPRADATIVVSGSGQPGREVTVDVNGQQAASTVVGEDGTWTVEVDAGNEAANITVHMLSPDGEVAETVDAGEVAALESLAPTIESPGEDLQAGEVTLSGGGEPGMTLVLTIDGEEIGTTEVNGDGTWTADVVLPTGNYDVTVAAPEATGASGASSATISLQVAEPQAPSMTQLNLPIPSFSALTGALILDGEGTPGSRLAVVLDDEVADETTVDSDGRWRLNLSVPEGEHSLAFSRLDDTGETVSQSETSTIDLPGKLPQITLPDFAWPDELLTFAGLGAASSQGEETTADTAAADTAEMPPLKLPVGPIRVSGTAEPGMTVAFLLDGEVVDTQTADDAGAFAVTADLEEGAHTLQLGVLDEAGELAGESSTLPVEVFNAAVPTITDPGTTSGSGPVTLNGTADPGAQIEVTVDGTSAGETVAADDGSWSLDLPNLSEVAANVRARLLDSEGMPLLLSAPLVLTEKGTADAGTEAEGSTTASVSGSVTYKERIALPDDAVVTVQIQDISQADAAAKIVGEQVIEADGQQVPIPYEVPYNPADIEENHTYSAAARIEDSSGNLLFINDTVTPVITNDHPTEDVEIPTVKVDTTVSDVVLDQTTPIIGEDTDSAVAAAEASGQFSTLLDGLEKAGLTDMLADADGEYTLFAPTDEAFDSLPTQVVEAWDANPETYADLLRNMAVEGKYTPDDLQDGLVLQSVGGSEISISRDGDIIYVNGAPVADSAEAGKHYVYAIPQVILPPLPSGVRPPVIDEKGVPTFVGPLLTVVGLAEPGSQILLTVDDEPFGEIATVEPDGFWLVKQNVASGIRYILAYMLDEQGLLQAISQEVILPVP